MGRLSTMAHFIRFDNPNDADWFSRKYKAVWGKQYWDGQ